MADCSICSGSGYIRKNPLAEVGDPDFGKIEMCSCSIPSFSPTEMHGVDKFEYDGMSWDLIRPQVAGGLAYSQALRQIVDNGGMAYLYGGFGQGKTFAMKIAVVEVLRSGKTAAYANISSLLDLLRASFDADKASAALEERMSFYLKLDFLALDEWGRQNDTSWAKEQLFRLMDERYKSAIRKQNATALASNMAPADLPGYLASRINDERVIRVVSNAKDGRIGIPADWPW